MKHLLPDGRTLMARLADMEEFFATHRIVGRKIVDIRPADLYSGRIIIDDWDHAYASDTYCTAVTDEQVCLVFEDGDHCEIEVPGEAPVILGFNTAKLEEYPVYDGSAFHWRTMFQHCLGRTITEVSFYRCQEQMTFPCYDGFDMSEDDEGAYDIRLDLDDGTTLVMGGYIDWFEVCHCAAEGGWVSVPMKELLDELNEETRRWMTED